MVDGDIEAADTPGLDNIGALLKAGGLDFSAVVRTTVFLADMNDFAAMNEVYGSSSPNRIRRGRPSRSRGCRGTRASRSTRSRLLDGVAAYPAPASCPSGPFNVDHPVHCRAAT